ncbi:hypothetical protein Lumi_064 [Xylophilus phage Lumi]|nr:hypothetical protein Lumi_064 [Xylophilus phage Lumi]
MAKIEMKPVVSSNVKAIGHDGVDKMRVEFTHGGAYLYSGVGPQLYSEIAGAESVGKALTPIRKDPAKFPYVKD